MTTENENVLSKKFAEGWTHFCKCIDFGKSALDADAIRFMNEMPSKIIQTLNSQDNFLTACEHLIAEIEQGTDKNYYTIDSFIKAEIEDVITKAKRIGR